MATTTRSTADHRAARFERLRDQWKRETAHLGRVERRAMHPAYQHIIGMGPDAVPLILDELRRRPDDWFWALHAITDADPVLPECHGRMTEMANAWIRWGVENGYCNPHIAYPNTKTTADCLPPNAYCRLPTDHRISRRSPPAGLNW